jgi:hypothetical protein
MFITANKQLMKVNIQLDNAAIEERRAQQQATGSTEDYKTTFEYVHEHFHNDPINGMDICMRKQLIVTCSDSYIKVWNFANKSLEI